MPDQDKHEEEKNSPAKLSIEKPKLQDVSLVQMSTLLYSGMAAIGALIAIYYHKNFFTSLALPRTWEDARVLLAVSGLGIGVLLISGYLFEGWFVSFHKLKSAVQHILGPFSYLTGVYLALLSAVGEEILFRGAILPFTGLFFSACLFGLLHLDIESGKISAWSLWAFLAGLLLGWVYQTTNSLLPPIIIHFGVNCFSIIRLQRSQRRAKAPS